MPDVVYFNRWSLFLVAVVTLALLMAARLPIAMSAAALATISFPVSAIMLGLHFQGRSEDMRVRRAITALEGLGLMAATCLAFGVATYPILSFTSGWNDEYLNNIDLFIGFDWLYLVEIVQDHRWFSSMVGMSYETIALQPTLIIVLLAVMGMNHRVHHFVAATIITLAITVILVYFVPAKSAAVQFLGEDTPGLSFASSGHIPIINDLRAGIYPSIDINSLAGLIAFPSFHAAASVIYAWAALPIHWVRGPIIILNAFMMLASLLVGGHYLIEIIGGVVIALLAIKLAQRMPCAAHAHPAVPAGERTAWKRNSMPVSAHND